MLEYFDDLRLCYLDTLQLATFGDVDLHFPLLRRVSAVLKVENQQEYLRNLKTCLF